jgi:hypothetical protein
MPRSPCVLVFLFLTGITCGHRSNNNNIKNYKPGSYDHNVYSSSLIVTYAKKYTSLRALVSKVHYPLLLEIPASLHFLCILVLMHTRWYTTYARYTCFISCSQNPLMFVHPNLETAHVSRVWEALQDLPESAASPMKSATDRNRCRFHHDNQI